MNDGGPAFPLPLARAPDGTIYNSAQQSEDGGGMSLRDWFAGMALHGIYANTECNSLNAEQSSQWAYSAADAMILQRAIKVHSK